MAVKVSRIEKEYILRQMLDGGLQVEIRCGETLAKARLEKMLPDSLGFAFLEAMPGFQAPPHVDLFIPFRGTRVTCRLKVKVSGSEGLATTVPDALYRDLDRGFERVEPDEEVKVSILLDGVEYILDFPSSQGFYEPEPPAVNIRFDAGKIVNLLKAFREKALSMASENRIVMFRERKPAGLPEEIMAISGLPLLLPMHERGEMYGEMQLMDSDSMGDLCRSIGKDPLTASNELAQHVERMRKRNVRQEFYCPVLFRQYVVGYIYLMKTDVRSPPFPRATLEFVTQFSRILAYSLQQNEYFQAMKTRKSFDRASLVDISGSGLLFSMPLNGPSLDILDDVDLQIAFTGRVLPAKGRVMRHFQDQERVYLGIKFTEMPDDGQEYLMEKLYGHRYPDITGSEMPMD